MVFISDHIVADTASKSINLVVYGIMHQSGPDWGLVVSSDEFTLAIPGDEVSFLQRLALGLSEVGLSFAIFHSELKKIEEAAGSRQHSERYYLVKH